MQAHPPKGSSFHNPEYEKQDGADLPIRAVVAVTLERQYYTS